MSAYTAVCLSCCLMYRNGATALHHAAAHGAADNAKYLLAMCNADPTLLDKERRSAAQHAADAGHMQLAEELLRLQ
jgi:ankyrin repeat protein